MQENCRCEIFLVYGNSFGAKTSIQFWRLWPWPCPCTRLFLRLSGDFVVTMGYGGSVKTFQLFGIQYSPAFYQRKNCASTNAIYETMQNLAIAVFLSIQPISCTEDIARSVTQVSFYSLCLANHGDTTQFLRTPVTVSDCNPLLRLVARSGSWLSHVTILWASLLFTIAFG